MAAPACIALGLMSLLSPQSADAAVPPAGPGVRQLCVASRKTLETAEVVGECESDYPHPLRTVLAENSRRDVPQGHDGYEDAKVNGVPSGACNSRAHNAAGQAHHQAGKKSGPRPNARHRSRSSNRTNPKSPWQQRTGALQLSMTDRSHVAGSMAVVVFPSEPPSHVAIHTHSEAAGGKVIASNRNRVWLRVSRKLAFWAGGRLRHAPVWTH
jgi:hypothetical protein